jgi:hypothetical protein
MSDEGEAKILSRGSLISEHRRFRRIITAFVAQYHRERNHRRTWQSVDRGPIDGRCCGPRASTPAARRVTQCTASAPREFRLGRGMEHHGLAAEYVDVHGCAASSIITSMRRDHQVG